MTLIVFVAIMVSLIAAVSYENGRDKHEHAITDRIEPTRRKRNPNDSESMKMMGEILNAWAVYKLQHDGRRSHADVDKLQRAMRILDREQNRRLNNDRI